MKDLQDLLKEKVETYEFEPLLQGDGKQQKDILENFQFENLDRNKIIDSKKHEKVIQIERKAAQKSQFNIAPIVREHRGINKQEEFEKERRIQEEVERRIMRLEKEAYEKGYVEGLELGKKEVFDQTRAQTEEKLSNLSELIGNVLSTKEEILSVEKESIYVLVRNLVKWVTLKELKDDGEYLSRLLEKLLTELQTKSNVLIQVDEKSFERMPDVLDNVQRSLGKMENVRIEIDYDIEGPGIIIESENGIINGTMKEQFRSFDRLFLKVGVPIDGDIKAEDFIAEEIVPDKHENIDKETASIDENVSETPRKDIDLKESDDGEE